MLFKLANGDGCHMIFIRSDGGFLRAWAIRMMFGQCTFRLAIGSIDTCSITDITLVRMRQQWSKDDNDVKVRFGNDLDMIIRVSDLLDYVKVYGFFLSILVVFLSWIIINCELIWFIKLRMWFYSYFWITQFF